ncbi:uncharacterized protein LOC111863880 [Cryptotermes secundus]|uniref:uncharacterized protein LOC111863880 n=1 Tax=Cryptotermes secundus TaxID=105785 RepID=UPI000CD7DACB|nr:uncharacterized protein LOC111863880 [Cryptotermes secundus]
MQGMFASRRGSLSAPVIKQVLEKHQRRGRCHNCQSQSEPGACTELLIPCTIGRVMEVSGWRATEFHFLQDSSQKLTAQGFSWTMSFSSVANRTATRLQSFRWEIMEHAPYSPDLAPSDYVFGPLKKFLAGQRFISDDAKTAVQQWFRAEPAKFYNSSISN